MVQQDVRIQNPADWRESGKGRPVRRSEDARLVAGKGRFIDDIHLHRECVAVFVRSPHAHADITAIDTCAARALAGVIGVFTAADVDDSLGPLPCIAPVRNRDGTPIVQPPRHAIVGDTVRHVGDTVAMVVAETHEEALAAAEALDVTYAEKASVSDLQDAANGVGAPIWPEADDNLCFDWETGDRARADRAFEQANRVVKIDLVNNRLVANSLETRGAIAEFDASTRRYTLYTSTQGAHLVRQLLARDVLRVPLNRIRVVTPDVGGGFGMKMYLYPEQTLVLWAARKLERPVRWIGERTDAFVTDTHGRDHVAHGELALDDEHRFIAVRCCVSANLGAYLSTLGPFIPTAGGSRAITGPYAIANAHVAVRGFFTNTVPVDAYRGAGRPEYVYLMERLVDAAASECGLDPVKLRRRNLVPESAMPYRTALGQRYDSGNFERNLDDALKQSDWNGFAARRDKSAATGRLRGIGLSCYVEPCGGNRDQFASLTCEADGSVTLYLGAQSNGQGHETAFAQILVSHFAIPIERIAVVEGDTDRVAYGRGTSGSRSLPIGGPATHLAALKVVEKGRLIAAHLLEAGAADISFSAGQFKVAGTDRSISFDDMLSAAYDRNRLPAEIEPGMTMTGHYDTKDTTYPNGAHIAEVEIDPETGSVALKDYVAVDDFGVIVNPMLVEGQMHGGIAQGIGQALSENCVYDGTSGQLITGNLLDYALPRADDLTGFRLSFNECPCTTNVLGVKGCGEAGTIAAPAAVMNAVIDALRPLGVDSIDMPATPDRIWTTIRRAATASADATAG